MRQRRSFTPKFKKSIIETLEAKQKTLTELATEYALNPSLIIRWRKDFRRSLKPVESIRRLPDFQPGYAAVQDLKTKIADLYFSLDRISPVKNLRSSL